MLYSFIVSVFLVYFISYFIVLSSIWFIWSCTIHRFANSGIMNLYLIGVALLFCSISTEVSSRYLFMRYWKALASYCCLFELSISFIIRLIVYICYEFIVLFVWSRTTYWLLFRSHKSLFDNLFGKYAVSFHICVLFELLWLYSICPLCFYMHWNRSVIC